MRFGGILFMTLAMATSVAASAEWQPTTVPLMTRWGKAIDPEKVHQEYPRPQLVRKDWVNLNGLWDLSIQDASTSKVASKPPEDFNRKILVPFPVESALSGVGERVGHVWYKRSLDIPKAWDGRRILLHFGAVDFESHIYLNGKKLAEHKGGYDPFSVDITEALTSGAQELIVGVYDGHNKEGQPHGKQTINPHGIWYTPSTGIWQTVWMEPVNPVYVENFLFEPNVDESSVHLRVAATAVDSDDQLRYEILDGSTVVAKATIDPVAGKLDDFRNFDTGPYASKMVYDKKVKLDGDIKLWSPESPFLYTVKLFIERDGKALDTVESYFGMRKIEQKSDGKFQRMYLNGKEVFHAGPLDQGFWPESLHTPPSDDALKWDIEQAKRFGFNTIRKHIKVEPARWYYWTDKLGVLVWQDMVNSNNENAAQKKQFELELMRMLRERRNSPSIVMWVPFNEAWGQYDAEGTARIVDMIAKYDPTRLINNASGWIDRGVGDTIDVHKYPGPGAADPETTRVSVLGEFGGMGLKVEGHTWAQENWGYQGTDDKDGLQRRFDQVWRRVHYLDKNFGLSAAIYTQITDVETETNGLVTYDREVVKLDEERAKAAILGNAGEYKRQVIMESSEREPQEWQYTTSQPSEDWTKIDASTDGWETAPGGFGIGSLYGKHGTEWTEEKIWLRKEFTMPEGVDLSKVRLYYYHDNNGSEIYLNGVKASGAGGHRTGYEEYEIERPALETLKPGKNVIALHAHKGDRTVRFVDIGIIAIEE